MKWDDLADVRYSYALCAFSPRSGAGEIPVWFQETNEITFAGRLVLSIEINPKGENL
jgi:hypothetical protein